MTDKLPWSLMTLAIEVDRLLHPTPPVGPPLTREDVPTVKECWDMYAGSFNEPK